MVGSNSGTFVITSAAGGTRNVFLRSNGITENVVSINSDMGTSVGTRHEGSVVHGRATTRLLRTTLHHILNARIRRTNRLMGTARMEFSFARFGPLAARRVGVIRLLIGSFVLGSIPIAVARVPVRRTGGLNTVVLFNRGCNSVIHIIHTNSFSARFYNNARISGDNRVKLFGVISRSSITTNMEHVATMANTKLLTCLSIGRTLIGNISTTLGANRGRIRRHMGTLVGRLGSGRGRVGGLGTRLTGLHDTSTFSGPVSIYNLRLCITEMSNSSPSTLHSVNSSLGTGNRGIINMITNTVNSGTSVITIYNGRTVTGNIGTNGLIGRVTGLTGNNNNNHPSSTVTNTGSVSGLSSTLTTTGDVIRNFTRWVMCFLPVQLDIFKWSTFQGQINEISSIVGLPRLHQHMQWFTTKGTRSLVVYLFYRVVGNGVPDAGVCRSSVVCTFESVGPITPIRFLIIPGTRVSGIGTIATRGDGCITHVFRGVPRVTGGRNVRSCEIVDGYNRSTNRAIVRLRFRIINNIGVKRGVL